MFAETFRSIMGFNTVILERHCFWKGIVQNWKYIRSSGDVTHPTLKARPKKGERKRKFCLLQEKNTIMGKQPRIEGGRVIWLMCKCLPCLASLLFANIKFITGVYRYLQALTIHRYPSNLFLWKIFNQSVCLPHLSSLFGKSVRSGNQFCLITHSLTALSQWQ